MIDSKVINTKHKDNPHKYDTVKYWRFYVVYWRASVKLWSTHPMHSKSKHAEGALADSRKYLAVSAAGLANAIARDKWLA